MKLATCAAALATLLAAPALAAQAPAAPAKTVAASTKTAAGTTATKTTAKGAPQPRTAASLACSKQADAQNIHGKARKKMMSSCKAAAKKA